MTEPPRKKLRSMRRGTKSCLECRIRKRRCIYSCGDENSPCDGCQVRQIVCESQEEAENLDQIREPMRERVDRLEVIVENLSNTVSELQRASREPESYVCSESVPNERNEFSPCKRGDSIIDNTTAVGPGRTKTQKNHSNRIQELNSSAHGVLLNLVPSRSDVLLITTSSTDWWHIHNALFPEPAIRDRASFLKLHDQLHQPNTSSATIMLWLVYFAVTFLQLPKSFDRLSLESITNPENVVSRISEAGEAFLAEDSTMRTLEGIKGAAMFAQLQKHLGRPKKGWLILRRAMAFAEVLNLHSARKALKMSDRSPRRESDRFMTLLEDKSNLWSSLCATDRLLSLLLGLPTAASSFTSSYATAQSPSSISSDPYASTRRIISVQSSIANQIFHRDQIEDPVEARSETDDIVNKLSALQKTWPPEWSNIDRWATSYDAKAATCVLFQTGHSFLVLRTLLPFLLHNAAHGERSGESREAGICLQACRDILKRYYAVRTRLNVGGFMSRSFDVHAFTACLIILLRCHIVGDGQRSAGKILHLSATDAALVENAKAAMKMVGGGEGGGEALRKMIDILGEIQLCVDGEGVAREKVEVRVPLLGLVCVRRISDAEGSIEVNVSLGVDAPVENLDCDDDEEWSIGAKSEEGR